MSFKFVLMHNWSKINFMKLFIFELKRRVPNRLPSIWIKYFKIELIASFA